MTVQLSAFINDFTVINFYWNIYKLSIKDDNLCRLDIYYNFWV